MYFISTLQFSISFMQKLDTHSISDFSQSIIFKGDSNYGTTLFQAAEQKASLLLIDRTLDMSSAIGHHADSLLDRILRVLPGLPSHNVDVSVDMSPLCNTVK